MALFFLTRVELHGAVREQYVPLHDAMAKAGFRREIVTDKGSSLQLPWAEYAYFGATTSSATLELAQAAVRSVWQDFEILVCEVNSWWSVGLAPAASQQGA